MTRPMTVDHPMNRPTDRRLAAAALIVVVTAVCSAAQAAAPQPAKRIVEAGPIWDQADANLKCPAVCAAPARWTGQWWTTIQGRMSVCECEWPAPPPPQPPPAPPAQAPAAFATIYEHPGFVGRSAVLGVGRFDHRQLRLANDSLSSLRVPPGLQVTLHEHKGFQGRTKVFTADAPTVGADFNDQTSAIVVEALAKPALAPPPPPAPPPPAPLPQPQPAAVVTLFEHFQFTGQSAVLGVGSYDVHQMRLPNDSLSSLRVPPGLRVTLYEHGGFGGRALVVTTDTGDIGKAFNDLTSSVVVALVDAPQPQVQPRLPPPPPPPVQAPPPAEPVPQAPQAMSDQLFSKLIKHMKDASFPKEQLATLGDELAVGSKLNTVQVIRVMEVLTFPDYQVKGVLLMWPSVVDPQNLPDVLAAFTFASHRDQVRKGLKR